MRQRLRLFRNIAFVLPTAVMASVASGQTTGDSTAGQQLFTTTLSPQCSGCHSTTNAAAANPLTTIRNNITNRVTPAGAAGTMSFAKALEALDKALTGSTLGGAVTGMNMLYTLTSTQRGDLAAYIAGLAGPAPVISYSPTGGAIFPATAVGASASTTVTIRNTGTAALTFATNNAVTVATGGDAADFRVTTSSCPATTLQPNTGSCTINVTFTPAAGASLTRSASIGLATTTTTSLVPLTGSVSVAPPATGAANAPASGGGGGLHWAALLLLAGLVPARRSERG
jgi:mono/diheme cytochrome c family protein